MRKIGLFHPVVVFITTLVALIISLYLYIDSYIRVNEKLREFIASSGLPRGQFRSTETWVMILTMSILVALIIVGMVIIFFYYQKNIQLYRMQQNFINGFTHELKTPIASLRIFIETMALHKLEREKELELFDLMKRDTERLQENVDQILNLAKIEDRSFVPDLVSINLSAFIPEFTTKQKHLLSSAEIEFLDVKKDFLIFFDKRLLEIVFMNILTNAINHNLESQKKISISIVTHHTTFEVIVTDNGMGLKKENLKDVFKKFYQIGKSAKGSGLGLYIVWQIMRIHKSNVWATSEGPGTGCQIHLSFKKG